MVQDLLGIGLLHGFLRRVLMLVFVLRTGLLLGRGLRGDLGLDLGGGLRGALASALGLSRDLCLALGLGRSLRRRLGLLRGLGLGLVLGGDRHLDAVLLSLGLRRGGGFLFLRGRGLRGGLRRGLHLLGGLGRGLSRGLGLFCGLGGDLPPHLGGVRGRGFGLGARLGGDLLAGRSLGGVRRLRANLELLACHGDLHSDASLALDTVLREALPLLALLAHQAVVSLGAGDARSREGASLAVVNAMGLVVVLGAGQRLALQAILADAVMVLRREEAALVAPRTLLDALLQPPVPELAHGAEALARRLGCGQAGVDDVEHSLVDPELLVQRVHGLRLVAAGLLLQHGLMGGTEVVHADALR
mmetsp:Transcript_65340/g.168175  ORF Transcript_65340/g.168175 Transcript_65340/m.168175 type:complete len:359 (+) Transcript_65340:1203-2279(+)